MELTREPCQPPQNTEAEWALVGLIINHPTLINQTIGKLKPEDFYSSKTKRIYSAMVEMAAAGEDITVPGIGNRYPKEPGIISDCGHAILYQGFPHALESYINLIKSTAMRRKAITIGRTLMLLAIEEPDVQKIVNYAQDGIYQLDKGVGADYEMNADLLFRHFDTLQTRNTKKGLAGERSGFVDLDNITGGWRPGQLIFLGAVPKAGKTSFALHCALNCESPVLFFSMEMLPEEMADRELAVQAEVNSQDITTGRIKAEDWTKLSNAMGALCEKKVGWVRKSGLTTLEIKAVARRFQSEHNLGLIVIDQLDKISETRHKGESRTDQIGRVTRGLKEMAMDLEVPVLCLVQLLDKAISQRKNPRPSIGDVRDSSYPDQDADIMLNLWRPCLYWPNRTEYENMAEVIISRHRAGPTGSIWVRWVPEYTKFQSLAKEYWPKKVSEEG
jgi:replicative DNA helicase